MKWTQLAECVSAGEYPHTVLRKRGTDVLVVRANHPEVGSAILKFWNRPGGRGYLRRWSRSGTAYRERAAMEHLFRNGVRVPRVYALVRLRGPMAQHTECLIEEDLGSCTDSTEHLKALILGGNVEAEMLFEQEVLSSTRIMVESRLLDTDHRLPNYVVAPDGNPVRLDFELARRVIGVRLCWRMYGKMLGTLLGSYVFAVQPDHQRMSRFAKALCKELTPPKRVLRVASAQLQSMLERQMDEIGMNTTFMPSWEDA